MAEQSFDEVTLDLDHPSLVECQTSVNKNDAQAMLTLGWRYEYGIDMEKDEYKAFECYQKSAKIGNPEGMYQVGYCYYLGIGVEVDKCKAFKHYLKSAEAGYSMGIWKTAFCYYYGIGTEKNENKYDNWINKSPDYGKCTHCNEYNTYQVWCLTCDPDVTIREWTSGNKDIDDCINEFQLRTNNYESMIEWIPFDRLNDIKKIGEGGFGSVFSSIWLDGIRKIKKIEKTDNDENDKYVRSREPSSIVALKSLSGSKENPHLLKEFDHHTKCRLYGSKLALYGITQNTETNEYFMVFQYANNGSLHKFLTMKFRDITWQIKLKLLKDILYDLSLIHEMGYIHADFHSGNILQHEGISKGIKGMQSYISDLGLSRKADENDLEGGIYGVIPYVAPEVLSGQKFTKAADVYGFDVIMSEMSTGQRPFDGYEFGIDLTMKICNGLRPDFAPGTPDCYIELAKQCMCSDPQQRPSALDVWEKLCEWNKGMEDSDDANEFKKQFSDADKIENLPIISLKHPDHMYTSKIIKINVQPSKSMDFDL